MIKICRGFIRFIRSFFWLWQRMSSFDLRWVPSLWEQRTRRKYLRPRLRFRDDYMPWLWFHMMIFISRCSRDWVMRDNYSGKVLGILAVRVITNLRAMIARGMERAPTTKKLVQNSRRTWGWEINYFVLSFWEFELGTSEVLVHVVFIVGLVEPTFL